MTLDDLQARADKATVPDSAKTANQSLRFAHQLPYLVQLAKVMVDGALARNESRGAHYKPEFEKRDDENWMKTTMANYDAKSNAPALSYAPVDARFIKPRPRTYGAGGS